MMYQITKEFNMECAHFLDKYIGACNNMHGHTYRVSVTIRGEQLDELGMLVDFSKIKSLIFGRYDHSCLNDWSEFKNINPTAENLAQVIWERVEQYCSTLSHRPHCVQVTVWETSTSSATYTPFFINLQ